MAEAPQDPLTPSEIFPGMQSVKPQETVVRRGRGGLTGRGFIRGPGNAPMASATTIVIPNIPMHGVAVRRVDATCNVCNGNGWIYEQEGGGAPKRISCFNCGGTGSV